VSLKYAERAKKKAHDNEFEDLKHILHFENEDPWYKSIKWMNGATLIFLILGILSLAIFGYINI